MWRTDALTPTPNLLISGKKNASRPIAPALLVIANSTPPATASQRSAANQQRRCPTQIGQVRATGAEAAAGPTTRG